MEYSNKQNYTSFKRYCKVLSLKDDPQLISEYKAAHNAGAVWPEITQGMLDVGILDMEIYLHDTRLFMIMDTIPDFDYDSAMARLGAMPRQSEWEKAMSNYQESSSDASAESKWQCIERIYKLSE